MVGILLDTNYKNSLWCKNLYESLTARLREKRISFCEIFSSCPKALDAVFIIASDREWTSSAIRQLNAGGRTPILICNQSEHLPGCIYSCVCSDISTSMKNVLRALKAKSKRKIALYGINTESIGDTSRVDSLFVWKEQDFETMQVFTNNGSLSDCFERFYARLDEFDAAICANDFAAVSLVRSLRERAPERLSEFSVISCVGTELSNHYRDRILSLNLNFEQYGKAAVYLFEALTKHAYLSEMTVKVPWSLDEDVQAVREVALQFGQITDGFYKDPELAEMLTVDKLLTCSDEVDKTILQGLIRGQTYEQVAEACFLAVGSIKYRIRKLLALSGASDKGQMVALLRKYLAE